jgi:DNA-binding MarR family transcriptional regulator
MAESGAWSILFALASEGGIKVSGSKLQELTGLNPAEINGAVTLLELAGYVESLRYLRTEPFDFGHVILTSRGRYEYERLTETNTISRTTEAEIVRSPIPAGSPYGFSDEDWEIVAEIKGKSDQLQVIFGYQFKSDHYNTETLKQNVEKMFQKAVEAYNKLPNAITVELNFKPLAAGYGEHLFNAIARAIISADIAVFDTSDLNSNVMIEIGVALTWGVRVLPIKREKCPNPPSDISGQTWADYRNSGSEFVDHYHGGKLLEMVEHAARKKGRTLSNASNIP